MLHQVAAPIQGAIEGLSSARILNSADAVAVLLQESHPDGSRVVRAVLTEVNSAGHWPTRLTAAGSGARPWVWLDVDGSGEQADGSGRRQWTSTPNLAKSMNPRLTDIARW